MLARFARVPKVTPPCKKSQIRRLCGAAERPGDVHVEHVAGVAAPRGAAAASPSVPRLHGPGLRAAVDHRPCHVPAHANHSRLPHSVIPITISFPSSTG